jgi:hypothetical protein
MIWPIGSALNRGHSPEVAGKCLGRAAINFLHFIAIRFALTSMVGVLSLVHPA